MVMQEIDGCLQADKLHRVERQKAHPFVATVCSLEEMVGCEDSLNHRQGERGAGS